VRGMASQGSYNHNCHPASQAESQNYFLIFFHRTFHSLPQILQAAFQLLGAAETARYVYK